MKLIDAAKAMDAKEQGKYSIYDGNYVYDDLAGKSSFLHFFIFTVLI
jgi:hypothetical protein